MRILDQIIQVVSSGGEQQSGDGRRVFISYKRHVRPDQRLAVHLKELLEAEGQDAYIDLDIPVGEDWSEVLDRRIKTSDFFIVLLSRESARSEMVQAEIKLAHEYCKEQGRPRTLPVRIDYEGRLPYSIDALLDPLQYVLWRSEADDEKVAQRILAVMDERPSEKELALRSISDEDNVISEDGEPVIDDETLPPPLPEFDPRTITHPRSGPVKPRDRLYIERQDDEVLRDEIVNRGSTTTIRAPRQTGKTSLLVRGLHHAHTSDLGVVMLDLGIVDRDRLSSYEDFLHDLAVFVVKNLNLDEEEVERCWGSSLGAQARLTDLFTDYILPSTDKPFVLAIDEADRLLETAYHQDFFGLVRAWHNSRAHDDQWNKLNLVMVISTEPFLLISDLSQSPFNVGRKLYLEDFNEAQVRDLNQCHGSPVEEPDFPQLMQLLNGHPFLTRLALYELIDKQMTWAKLAQVAASDRGPFGSHMRHYYWQLRDKPNLKKALKRVIRRERCTDEMVFYRLLRAGLVKGSGDRCTCRCELYRMYFQEEL
jgi:hypothetical protein